MNYEQVAGAAQRKIESGNITGGISLLRKAIRTAEERGDLVICGVLLSRCGMAQKRAGDPTCRDTLLKAVRILKEENAQEELTVAWDNLGFIESDLGNLEEARYCHEEALRLARAGQDPQAEAHALMNLCILYKDYDSQITKALAYAEQALSLLKKQDNPHDEAHTLVSLGLLYERLQRIEDARTCYEQALPLYRRVHDRENEALTLHNLALLLDKQADYPNALRFYKQSLETNLEIGAKWGIAADLSSLGSLLQGVHQWEQARHFHEAALAIQRKIGDRRGQLDTLTDLGIVAGQQDDYAKAIRYLSRALRLAKQMFDPHSQYEVYSAKGDIEVLADHPQKAVNSYIQALTAIESVRARLLLEQEALSFFTQDRLEVYDRLVYVYQDLLQLPDEALTWAERSKTREFLRRLGTTRLSISLNVPTVLLEREAVLFDKLRQLTEYLTSTVERGVAQNATSIVEEYEASEATLQDVWNEIATYDAEYVALRRGEPTPWEKLREFLTLA